MLIAALRPLSCQKIWLTSFIVAGVLLGLLKIAHADDTSPTLQPNGTVIQVPGGMTLQAIGTEQGQYDSNPLLLIHGAKPLWGSVTTPELIFNDKTPLTQLSVDTLIKENLFNDSSFDSTDVHQKIGLNEQMQRWGAGFTQQTDYDTTRTSELFPLGLGATSANKAVRHLGLNFSPNVTFSPNTTNKFSLSGAVQDSQYDDPIFTNYATASLTPTWAHNFDPENIGTFSIQAQRYMTTSGPKVTDDTIGPSIGWNRILTERFTARVNVGFQEQRQYGSGAIQEPWSTQYTYSAGLTFKGQQDNLDVSASRANYAFGNATQSLLTSFAVVDTHAINQEFSINGGATYQSASYQSAANGNLDFLATGTAGLTYHATEHLDFTGSYQYRYEAVTGTSDNAQDHTFTIGLTYRPRAWTL